MVGAYFGHALAGVPTIVRALPPQVAATLVYAYQALVKRVVRYLDARLEVVHG